MNWDDEADPPGSEIPQSLPPVGPVPVLPYHGIAPTFIPRSLTFKREGDAVTFTFPPAPGARRLVMLSIGFLAWAILTLALCANFVPSLLRRSFPANLAEFICPSLFILLLGWGTLRTLRRLIYVARYGKQPSTIRIWPEGIEVRAHGVFRPVAFSLPREMIAHVQIRYARHWPMESIWLEISAKDGELHLANFRWPANMPTQKLQDTLRGVLKLSPDQLPLT